MAPLSLSQGYSGPSLSISQGYSVAPLSLSLSRLVLKKVHPSEHALSLMVLNCDMTLKVSLTVSLTADQGC